MWTCRALLTCSVPKRLSVGCIPLETPLFGSLLALIVDKDFGSRDLDPPAMFVSVLICTVHNMRSGNSHVSHESHRIFTALQQFSKLHGCIPTTRGRRIMGYQKLLQLLPLDHWRGNNSGLVTAPVFCPLVSCRVP